jgi:hypothetical protein
MALSGVSPHSLRHALARLLAAANAAGAQAEAVMLAEHGMPGQSHMLMQDRNSLQLAQWLAQWIAAKAPR